MILNGIRRLQIIKSAVSANECKVETSFIKLKNESRKPKNKT
jgi:hypothetical protein